MLGQLLVSFASINNNIEEQAGNASSTIVLERRARFEGSFLMRVYFTTQLLLGTAVARRWHQQLGRRTLPLHQCWATEEKQHPAGPHFEQAAARSRRRRRQSAVHRRTAGRHRRTAHRRRRGPLHRRRRCCRAGEPSSRRRRQVAPSSRQHHRRSLRSLARQTRLHHQQTVARQIPAARIHTQHPHSPHHRQRQPTALESPLAK